MSLGRGGLAGVNALGAQDVVGGLAHHGDIVDCDADVLAGDEPAAERVDRVAHGP